MVIIGPDDKDAFQRFWIQQQLPYIGIPDPAGHLLAYLNQEVTWWRLGRMPAIQIFDQTGALHWSHNGTSMKDIPTNAKLLEELRLLQ